jgi:hypothetical protein
MSGLLPDDDPCAIAARKKYHGITNRRFELYSGVHPNHLNVRVKY